MKEKGVNHYETLFEGVERRRKVSIVRKGFELTDELKLGVKEGLIKIKDSRIEYSAQRKSYDLTDPKEQVRARTYVTLTTSYKYPPHRMALDVEPSEELGFAHHAADIVVYEDDKLEVPFLTVEVRGTSKSSEIEAAKFEGLEKAGVLEARFLLLVCGEVELAYDLDKYSSPGTLDSCKITAIPMSYAKVVEYPYKKGAEARFELSVPTLSELTVKFQQCYDVIHGTSAKEPVWILDELSKLIFTKIYDESFTTIKNPYQFQVGSYENSCTIARRIRGIYTAAQAKEPSIFFKREMETSDDIIFQIVEILQGISLLRTDPDVKGGAFETLLSKGLKGEGGKFFTPREIVDFMVKMIDPTERELIMDPACGSGGFLIHSMDFVRDKVKQKHKDDVDLTRGIDHCFRRFNVSGIEENDHMVNVAIMNMVLHGDGRSNIECHDALDDYNNFDQRRAIEPNRYHVVFLNPPLGTLENRRERLRNFALGSQIEKGDGQWREILFIERCLDLLRPAGRMAIILPDPILGDPSFQYIRAFIDRKAKILAVVSLPPHAFTPYGGNVKVSVLFLQKKDREDRELGEYSIFTAQVDHIGYDAQGKPDENDLYKIVEDYKEFRQSEAAQMSEGILYPEVYPEV